MEGKQLGGAAEGAKSGEDELCFHCHDVAEYLLCCWCPANLDSPLPWGDSPARAPQTPLCCRGSSSSTSLAVGGDAGEPFHGKNRPISLYSSLAGLGLSPGGGAKALESPSLPTLGVRTRLGKGYFYLWSEEPFSPLSSCQAVFVGGSRQCFKNIHFQQTSSWGLVNFIWPARSHLPAPSAAPRDPLGVFISLFVAFKRLLWVGGEEDLP